MLENIKCLLTSFLAGTNFLSSLNNAILQLDMYAQDAEGDLSNYQENGEFKLESIRPVKHCVVYSCCPNPFPDITYLIVLRRRPMFYVFNLILPCVLINSIGE